jgi:hypothetical protein
MMMDERRAGLYSAGAVVSFNLIFFILTSASLFGGRMHHHWVLPLEAFFLGLQVVFFGRVLAHGKSGAWAATARDVSAWLLLLTCLIGTLRIETISACSEGCRFKLGLTYVLAGAALCLGWSVKRSWKRWDTIRFALGILLLSAGVVVLAGGQARPV